MVYSIVIKTERLVLRQATADDAAFMLQILNDPAFIQFVGDRGIKSLADAKADIENRLIRSYRELGFGFYIACQKDDLTPIGLCGLVKRDHLEDVDVGFAFLPEYRGQGLAYESAAAVLEYARTHLGLERIVAIVSADNAKSIALLEKLGLRFERPIQLPGDDEEISLYAWGAAECSQSLL